MSRWGLAGVVVLAGLPSLPGCYAERRVLADETAAVPVVVVALRDDLDTVRRRSSLDFSKPTLLMDVGGIVEAEARLVYSDARLGFELPIIKYIGFSRYVGRPGRNGQIYSIAFAPHRGVVSANEAWRLVTDVAEKLTNAGWHPDPLYLKSHFPSRPFSDFEQLVNDPRLEMGMRTNVGFWRSQTDVVTVSVAKVIQMGRDKTSRPLFNVIVDIEERSP
jgi:hypothetical protein